MPGAQLQPGQLCHQVEIGRIRVAGDQWEQAHAGRISADLLRAERLADGVVEHRRSLGVPLTHLLHGHSLPDAGCHEVVPLGTHR